MNRQLEEQAERETDRKIDREKEELTERGTDRKMNSQKEEQTERGTDKLCIHRRPIYKESIDRKRRHKCRESLKKRT